MHASIHTDNAQKREIMEGKQLILGFETKIGGFKDVLPRLLKVVLKKLNLTQYKQTYTNTQSDSDVISSYHTLSQLFFHQFVRQALQNVCYSGITFLVRW